MSTIDEHENVPLTLGQMYPRMSEAITHHGYFDLAIATWSLSVYGLEGHLPWNETDSHLKGFWQSLRKALTLHLTAEEWCWLIWMYGYIFGFYQAFLWARRATKMGALPLSVTLASTLDLRLDISRKFDKLVQRADVSVRYNCADILAHVRTTELRTYLNEALLELDGPQAYRAGLGFDIAFHKHLCNVLSTVTETLAQYGLDPVTHFRSELQSYIPEIPRRDLPIPVWCRELLLSVYESCLEYCFVQNASLLHIGLDLREGASLLYQGYGGRNIDVRKLLPGFFLLLNGTPNGLVINYLAKANDR